MLLTLYHNYTFWRKTSPKSLPPGNRGSTQNNRWFPKTHYNHQFKMNITAKRSWRAWSEDLIVFVGPGFDQSCSPGEGDIWIFLRPTWDRRGDGFDCRLGRKRLRPNICFPTSTLHTRDVRSGKICHAFYTWVSGSDDRGNPISRIDANKLIDWLIDCSVLFGDRYSK